MGLVKLAIAPSLLAVLVAIISYQCPSHAKGLVEFSGLVKGCVTDSDPWCSAAFLGWIYRLHVSLVNEMGGPAAEQVAAVHLQTGNQSLSGHVAIVTGANSGIGKETARVLMKHGCHVVLAVRSEAKGSQALAEIQAELGAGVGKGIVMKVDVSDFDSVKAFAMAFLEKGLPLNFLVANAGIMALPERKVSAQGLEMQFAANHAGHFLLARLLEEKLLASGSTEKPARAIFVSSAGHDMWENKGTGESLARLVDQIPPTRPYKPFQVYGMTKALNVLTAAQLQRRWGASGTAVAASLHPGLIVTNLLNANEGIDALFFGPLYRPFQKTVAQGASTTVYCITSPVVPTEARKEIVAYYANNALAKANALMYDERIAAEVWRLTEGLVADWLV